MFHKFYQLVGKKSENEIPHRIQIKGLMGGHFGISIDKERGNANKLLGRVLRDLSVKFPFSMQAVNGGLQSDAIIFIRPTDIEKVNENIGQWDAIFKNELQLADREVWVSFDEQENISLK